MKTLGFFHGAIGTCNFDSKQACPPTDHLAEKRAEIVPGMVNIWYEYVPKSYDPARKYPLVVELHGGGMDGKRWADISLWHVLAEEYGLIAIYPNSPDYQAWMLGERDVKYLYDLILRVCSEYSIDRSRIYMQGMSNGDQMTLAFSLKHPEVLAAAGYSTGPTALELFEEGERPVAPLPVIQMRGEKDVLYMHKSEQTDDVYADRYIMNDFNREIWEEVNGLDSLPALTVIGKDNYLFYKGRKADLINWEVKDMGHKHPPHEAQVFWNCLYSGRTRVDGNITDTGVKFPLDGQEEAVVISLGSGLLFKKDKTADISRDGNRNAVVRYFGPASVGGYGSLGLDEMFETGALFAPAHFFEAAFDAKVEYQDNGNRVLVTFNSGDTSLFYADSTLVFYKGSYCSMKKPCVLLCGIFYIPVGEFCEDMMGLYVSEADDCMLISKTHSQLGRYTARILRKILGGQRRPIPPKKQP
jgi:poly(3-hydroxybutyrate) depolymerase